MRNTIKDLLVKSIPYALISSAGAAMIGFGIYGIRQDTQIKQLNREYQSALFKYSDTNGDMLVSQQEKNDFDRMVFLLGQSQSERKRIFVDGQGIKVPRVICEDGSEMSRWYIQDLLRIYVHTRMREIESKK